MLKAIKVVRDMKAENQTLFMKVVEKCDGDLDNKLLSRLNTEMNLLEKVLDNLEIERKKS
jgi:hypothetical protein